MKQLGIRQWFVITWLICLFLPNIIFNIVEALQHIIWPGLKGSGWIIGPLSSALLAAGITLLGISWLASRWLLVPLATIERAALRIAAGDIDAELPQSRVREINEVAAAFMVMGNGLRAAVRQQAAMETERRTLISAVAHDLRTPLFALRGYLAGIDQGVAKTPEKITHYLAMCRAQAETLEQRVTALFDYTRLEYLAQAAACAPLRWDELVKETVERLQPAAAAKQIELAIAAADALCTIYGDVSMLARMLDNLAENAVRHTPAGGRIVLTWRAVPGRVEFCVADSGPGFAPADLPHVFAPLYRGAAENRATDGVGLGLATALRIAQMHGGGLEAANRAAGGAEIAGWISREQAG